MAGVGQEIHPRVRSELGASDAGTFLIQVKEI